MNSHLSRNPKTIPLNSYSVLHQLNEKAKQGVTCDAHLREVLLKSFHIPFMTALQHGFMLLGGDGYIINSVLSVMIYKMADLRDKLPSSSGTEHYKMFRTADGKEAMNTTQISER